MSRCIAPVMPRFQQTLSEAVASRVPEKLKAIVVIAVLCAEMIASSCGRGFRGFRSSRASLKVSPSVFRARFADRDGTETDPELLGVKDAHGAGAHARRVGEVHVVQRRGERDHACTWWADGVCLDPPQKGTARQGAHTGTETHLWGSRRSPGCASSSCFQCRRGGSCPPAPPRAACGSSSPPGWPSRS